MFHLDDLLLILLISPLLLLLSMEVSNLIIDNIYAKSRNP